jgi:hypothetical protein
MAEVMATGLAETCIRGTGRHATTVYSLKKPDQQNDQHE